MLDERVQLVAGCADESAMGAVANGCDSSPANLGVACPLIGGRHGLVCCAGGLVPAPKTRRSLRLLRVRRRRKTDPVSGAGGTRMLKSCPRQLGIPSGVLIRSGGSKGGLTSPGTS